jgi:ketosteroid isomerase-like protein
MWRLFELSSRGESAVDEAEALDHYHADVEMHAPGRLPDTNPTIRGREAMKAWAMGLYETFELSFEADEFIDASDSVVVFRQIARRTSEWGRANQSTRRRLRIPQWQERRCQRLPD